MMLLLTTLLMLADVLYIMLHCVSLFSSATLLSWVIPLLLAAVIALSASCSCGSAGCCCVMRLQPSWSYTLQVLPSA